MALIDEIIPWAAEISYMILSGYCERLEIIAECFSSLIANQDLSADSIRRA